MSKFTTDWIMQLCFFRVGTINLESNLNERKPAIVQIFRIIIWNKIDQTSLVNFWRNCLRYFENLCTFLSSRFFCWLLIPQFAITYLLLKEEKLRTSLQSNFDRNISYDSKYVAALEKIANYSKKFNRSSEFCWLL